MGGASWDSLISLARIFFSPVTASTYQSSPCSPASSRCTKDTLVPSGLHLIVSGARPVTPPSAKICSIVSCFGAAGGAWSGVRRSERAPRKAEVNRLVVKTKRSFFTNVLRFRMRCAQRRAGSETQECTTWKEFASEGLVARRAVDGRGACHSTGADAIFISARTGCLVFIRLDLRFMLQRQGDIVQAVQQTVAREFIHRESRRESLSVFHSQGFEIDGELVVFDLSSNGA